nr:MAG TPA: hypothetical protein [Caudoviricetes sp.]
MAAFLYSEASAINAEGNTNHSGARTAEGDPWASMASHPSPVAWVLVVIRARPGHPLPPRRRVLGVVIRHVQGVPFPRGWRRWGWRSRRVRGVPSPAARWRWGGSGTAPIPLPPRRGWRCADTGASHPSAAAAASGDPVTSMASPSATAGGAGGWSGASGASPSAMAAGAGGGERACLWWHGVLSTRYIGEQFYRPVTTIRRVIRPDFCVNANLQKFFSRKRQLAKFFMGDLCVNANQH